MALEWSELQATAVTVNELNALNWNEALEANIELYDYLQTVTSGEALLLVENIPSKDLKHGDNCISDPTPKEADSS